MISMLDGIFVLSAKEKARLPSHSSQRLPRS
jgi:hypothetical protein